LDITRLEKQIYDFKISFSFPFFVCAEHKLGAPEAYADYKLNVPSQIYIHNVTMQKISQDFGVEIL